jgi:hypothetical protein
LPVLVLIFGEDMKRARIIWEEGLQSVSYGNLKFSRMRRKGDTLGEFEDSPEAPFILHLQHQIRSLSLTAQCAPRISFDLASWIQWTVQPINISTENHRNKS